jgi:phage baseplate assembly protein gpV
MNRRDFLKSLVACGAVIVSGVSLDDDQLEIETTIDVIGGEHLIVGDILSIGDINDFFIVTNVNEKKVRIKPYYNNLT